MVKKNIGYWVVSISSTRVWLVCHIWRLYTGRNKYSVTDFKSRCTLWSRDWCCGHSHTLLLEIHKLDMIRMIFIFIEGVNVTYNNTFSLEDICRIKWDFGNCDQRRILRLMLWFKMYFMQSCKSLSYVSIQTLMCFVCLCFERLSD